MCFMSCYNSYLLSTFKIKRNLCVGESPVNRNINGGEKAKRELHFEEEVEK